MKLNDILAQFQAIWLVILEGFADAKQSDGSGSKTLTYSLYSLNSDTTFYLYPPVDRKGDVKYVIESADKDIHRPGSEHSGNPETE